LQNCRASPNPALIVPEFARRRRGSATPPYNSIFVSLDFSLARFNFMRRKISRAKTAKAARPTKRAPPICYLDPACPIDLNLPLSV
jgi:hypothetical protein